MKKPIAMEAMGGPLDVPMQQTFLHLKTRSISKGQKRFDKQNFKTTLHIG